jgi:hypothetical protein
MCWAGFIWVSVGFITLRGDSHSILGDFLFIAGSILLILSYVIEEEK